MLTSGIFVPLLRCWLIPGGDFFDIFRYACLSQVSRGAESVHRFHGANIKASLVLGHRFGLVVHCGRIAMSVTSLYIDVSVYHDSLRHEIASSSCR